MLAHCFSGSLQGSGMEKKFRQNSEKFGYSFI